LRPALVGHYREIIDMRPGRSDGPVFYGDKLRHGQNPIGVFVWVTKVMLGIALRR
jgi:hypothetical protein